MDYICNVVRNIVIVLENPNKIEHIETDYSSFPIIHKVGIIGISVPLKFEDRLDKEINPFSFISKHYGKYKFALKLTVSMYFR